MPCSLHRPIGTIGQIGLRGVSELHPGVSESNVQTSEQNSGLSKLKSRVSDFSSLVVNFDRQYVPPIFFGNACMLKNNLLNQNYLRTTMNNTSAIYLF